MKEQRIDLLDVLIVLLKRKKSIIIHFICICIVALVTALLWPKTYKATTVFLPPAGESGGLKSLVSGLSIDLLNSNKISPTQVETFVESREIKEKLIEKYDLIKVYKKENKPYSLDVTIKALTKNTKFEVLEDVGLGFSDVLGMSLTILDKSPVRCAEIANEYVTLVDEHMKHLNSQKARGEYEFIKKRIEDTQTELAVARAVLQAFQIKNKIYEISTQTKLTLNNLVNLRTEKLELETQRDYFKKKFSDSYSSHELKDLEQKIGNIDHQIRELETSPKNDVMIGLERSTSLGNEFQDLYLDVQIASKIIIFLRQKLEEKKVHAFNTTPLIRIIDKARPPQWKSSPKRAFMILGIVFVYMSFLFLFILLKHFLLSPQHISEERRQRIETLIEHAKFRK